MTASQTNAGTPEGPYTQKITFVELRASGVRNVLIAGTTNAATSAAKLSAPENGHDGLGKE